MADALRLYDAFAATYDAAFDTDPVRAAYERLAWERVLALLPPAPARVIDAGAGTGRGVGRLLDAGYAVTALEPSAAMRAVLHARWGDRAAVQAEGFETADLPPGGADAALAIGSLPYARDPGAALRRMAGWVRPGGLVCVLVDSLLGVVLELLRRGEAAEALRCAADGCGVFRHGGEQAGLHLFDRVGLAQALHTAGLERVEVCGVLVGAAALGRDGVVPSLADLGTERALAGVPALADAGKHLVGWGWRPG